MQYISITSGELLSKFGI